MGKKERDMQARKDAALREEQELLQKKLESLGVAKVDNELPPDEIDEKAAQKSSWYAFKAMIPYTDAWYESTQAEMEMDDLAKIRIERSKADDLVALSKLPGRHEEALQKLMSESDRDFHFFNNLRTKWEAEGKYKAPEKIINPFADIERGKNRLKKALRKQMVIIDDSVMKALGVRSKPIVQETKMPTAESPCLWRFYC